jgi:hypothetical protein
MPRPRSENELESLRAQAAALDQKIKDVAARDRARKAAEDHRRWLLAGQVAVQMMQEAPDGDVFRQIMRALDRHVKSASDRALFGLPSTSAPNGKGPDAAKPGASNEPKPSARAPKPGTSSGD